jgi:hypothetical protein
VEAQSSSISEAPPRWTDSLLSFEAAAYDEFGKICFSFKAPSLLLTNAILFRSILYAKLYALCPLRFFDHYGEI